jgi:hypothetical protein
MAVDQAATPTASKQEEDWLQADDAEVLRHECHRMKEYENFGRFDKLLIKHGLAASLWIAFSDCLILWHTTNDVRLQLSRSSGS